MIFLLVLATAGLTAHADRVLTWPACVELAAKNNSELQASVRRFEAARDLEGVARGGFFPSVVGSLNFDEGKLTAGGTTVDTPNPSSHYSATVSASQNLFNGLQDRGRVQQARANTAAVGADLDQSKAKISYDLKSAYQGLLYAKEYEEFTVGLIRRRESNMNLVKLLFESGRENKGSLLLSRAYLDQAHYEDLQSHNARQVAGAQLARTLGMDEDFAYDIQDQVPLHEPAPVDLRALAAVTPDVRRAQAQEESADAGVTVARSGFFPTLAVNGSVGKLGAEFFPHEADRWSVGVALVLPLFNGGRDYYGTRAASETWAAAASSHLNINRDVLARLRAAYTAYVEAIAKNKADQSFREAATLRAEIARKRYNNGLMTFEDWDLIENDLINRQRTYLQSKRDRVIAEAAWEQAQGKGVLP
jgi:outer membrane protein